MQTFKLKEAGETKVWLKLSQANLEDRNGQFANIC